MYRQPYWSVWLRPENKLNRQPPFCYRVLTPLLAGLLTRHGGVGIDASFYAITIAALAITSYLVGLIALDLSGSLIAAMSAAASCTFTPWLFAFYLYDYMLADPLAAACLSLSIYLLLHRHDALFLAVCGVGLLVRETQLVAFPAYWLRLAIDRRMTPFRIGASLAILGAYAAFRASIPVPLDRYTVANVFRGWPTPWDAGSWWFSVFGVLAIATLARLWRNPAALWLLPVAIGAALATAFSNDPARMYALAFLFVFAVTFGVRVRSLATTLVMALPGPLFILQQMAAASALVPLVAIAILNEVVFVILAGRERMESPG